MDILDTVDALFSELLMNITDDNDTAEKKAHICALLAEATQAVKYICAYNPINTAYICTSLTPLISEIKVS